MGRVCNETYGGIIIESVDKDQSRDKVAEQASGCLLKIEKLKAIVENLPQQNLDQSRDKVAEQLGVSGRQLDKIRYIIDKKKDKTTKREISEIDVYLGRYNEAIRIKNE